MSARLASFRGPSTPTPSPALQRTPQSPASPSRQVESTFHRKARTHLQELRSLTETWDDLVLHDGLKFMKALVDTRTELEYSIFSTLPRPRNEFVKNSNTLASLPDRLPRTYLVGPKLRTMDNCIASLELVVQKLDKQFKRINREIENLETLLIEAHRIKGAKWAREEPLWCTWPLERFVTSVRAILIPYHRSLHLHRRLVETVRSHSTPFEKAKEAVKTWAEQPFLLDDGWEARWEDICAVEVERWGSQNGQKARN